MSETLKTLLEETQHRLTQAIGAMGDAIDHTSHYADDGDVLLGKLNDIRGSIWVIDKRLGDLRSGRNQ